MILAPADVPGQLRRALFIFLQLLHLPTAEAELDELVRMKAAPLLWPVLSAKSVLRKEGGRVKVGRC